MSQLLPKILIFAYFFVVTLTIQKQGKYIRFQHTLKSSIKVESDNSLLGSNSGSISAAERVASAKSLMDVLNAQDLLIHPGQEKNHERQVVHQLKRIKTATAALKRIVKFTIGTKGFKSRSVMFFDERFFRLVVCAINPFVFDGHERSINPADTLHVARGFHCYCESIKLLATLVDDVRGIDFNTKLLPIIIENVNFIYFLMQKSEQLSISLSPSLISGLAWSYDRFGLDRFEESAVALKDIKRRKVALNLPFDVYQGMVKQHVNFDHVRKAVPFKSDVLVTKLGDKVTERRLTCWMADEGVGGLAYSGKVMVPVPFVDCVREIRDAIDDATGVYYDCCLINLYEDGECACKYHSDPDHGRLWAEDTVIVSIGETRRFNLREIPSEKIDVDSRSKRLSHPSSSHNQIKSSKVENDPYSFHLYNGDVFHMFGDCQETFQHCILKAEGEADISNNNGPRISIVFKKSLPGIGGRRGHGVPSSNQMICDVQSNSKQLRRNRGVNKTNTHPRNQYKSQEKKPKSK